MERPRSPRTTWLIHSPYCTCRGWVRPSSVRRRSRSSLVAWEPSMISAGSPGARRSTMKMTTDTPSRTGTSCRSRRARYRLTSLEGDRLHSQVEARVQVEALHPLGHRSHLDLVIDEDPGRILEEDPLSLAVQLRALGLLGRDPRLLEQIVEPGILVEGTVGSDRRTLAGMEETIE